jgi:hypothetical protein
MIFILFQHGGRLIATGCALNFGMPQKMKTEENKKAAENSRT